MLNFREKNGTVVKKQTKLLVFIIEIRACLELYCTQQNRFMYFSLKITMRLGVFSVSSVHKEFEFQVTLGSSKEKIQQKFYVSVTGSDSSDGNKENLFATAERARQEV